MARFTKSPDQCNLFWLLKQEADVLRLVDCKGSRTKFINRRHYADQDYFPI